MVIYGAKLVEATWLNSIDEFPELSVGVTYSAHSARRRRAAAVRHRARAHRVAPGPFRRACGCRAGADPASRSRAGPGSELMDIAVLLVTMFFCFLIGVPIAYSLGLAAIAAVIVDRHSARSGDAANLQRGQQGRDADHPLLRAGRRHHGGRRHGAAHGRLRRRAGRLHPRARRPFGRQCAGDDAAERNIRLVGRRRLGDRLGDDSANGEERISRASMPPM